MERPATGRPIGVRWALPAALLVLTSFGCSGERAEVEQSASGAPSSTSQEDRPSRLAVGRPEDAAATPGVDETPTAITAPRFADVSETSGLEFVYENGATGRALMVEPMGGGAGWLDYDRDGRQDLYLVQGGKPLPEPDDDIPSNRLFRPTGAGTFAGVTGEAGVGDRRYGQGVAVGDYDNDGFDDLYVTNIRHNVLYHNQGDGTFREVTRETGADDPRWSTSAAWGDVDRDGDLDLFVCNYLEYDLHDPLMCRNPDGEPEICHPQEFGPLPNGFLLNRGDGTFEPAAEARGLRGEGSKSLGVVIADFNHDSQPDIYVANDMEANFLFLNDGSGDFREAAVEHGCAVNGQGHLQASMGVAFGDYDRNGFPDLYLTHFSGDFNTLYANLGEAGFYDSTQETGLRRPSMPYLGFGTVMTDFNQDRRQDLFVANGHIGDWRHKGHLWHMPAQLFSFDGRQWREWATEAGPYFAEERIGRAAAIADYDEDGDPDLAVVHQNEPMALLRNESQRGHWLKVTFIGRRSNRRGIGARVTLSQDGAELVQQLPGGTSYCASHEPALFFGLGERDTNCDLEVRWPSGRVQTVEDVVVDRTLTLKEPAG